MLYNGHFLGYLAVFKAIVILKFDHGRQQSMQRIDTQIVPIYPRPSLKLYYFLTSSLYTTFQRGNEVKRPFNAMIAFMNAGLVFLHHLGLMNMV